MPEQFKLDRRNRLRTDEYEKVVEVLEQGGIIVYPTTTLYGLGAFIFSEEGLSRIMEAKNRPWGMPVSVFTLRERVCDICDIPVRALPLLDSGLPLSFVLPAKPNVPSIITNLGTLAVRFPDNDLLERLCLDVGPITATSANRHGGRDPSDVSTAKEELGDLVDVYIDGGRCHHGKGTTIVDLSGPEVKIIREGNVPGDKVTGLLDRARE